MVVSFPSRSSPAGRFRSRSHSILTRISGGGTWRVLQLKSVHAPRHEATYSWLKGVPTKRCEGGVRRSGLEKPMSYVHSCSPSSSSLGRPTSGSTLPSTVRTLTCDTTDIAGGCLIFAAQCTNCFVRIAYPSFKFRCAVYQWQKLAILVVSNVVNRGTYPHAVGQRTWTAEAEIKS